MGDGEPSESLHSSDGVEIRVHGIGDQDVWSALGSAPVISEYPPDDFPATSTKKQGPLKLNRRSVKLLGPPEDVRHDLILVSWSRLSRSGSALLWYLAFPYTLVNLAYEMRPDTLVRRRLHVVLVTIAAALLTMITTCWVTSFAELIVAFASEVSAAADIYSREIAVVSSIVFLVSVILTRAFREPESSAHRMQALAHSCVVVAVGAFGYFCRFPNWQIGEDSWARPVSIRLLTEEQLLSGDPASLPIPDASPLWLDPMGLAAYGFLITMLLVAAVLLCFSIRSRPGPAVGASFAIILSAILLTLIMSSLRFGLAEILKAPWVWNIIGFESPEPPISPDAVWLIRGGVESQPLFILPLVTAVVVLFTGLTLVISLRAHHLFRSLLGGGRKYERARWMHDTVNRLPSVLRVTSIITVVLGLGVVAAALLILVQIQTELDKCSLQGYCRFEWYNHVYLGSTVSIIAAYYLIRKINSSPALKEAVGGVADVAGFWPITVQPFGARTYRPYVVEMISAALRRIGSKAGVLVGHSQGSVLAAWTLKEQSGVDSVPAAGSIALVTCGSPLQSLYAQFFPSTFNNSWFVLVEQRVRIWGNFWRDTDPIATVLPYGSIDNVELPDPHPADPHLEFDGGGQVRAHSDYWIAPEQKTWIADSLRSESSASAE